MIKLEDIKEMLEQLHYTNIIQTSSKEFTAINPFKENRKFLLVGEKGVYKLISERNMMQVMNNKQNFQLVSCDFEDKEGGYKLTLEDYVVNNSMEAFTPEGIKVEKTDLYYTK